MAGVQASEGDHVAIDALCAMADEVGATPCCRRPGLGPESRRCIDELSGARRLDQLEANLVALDLNLDRRAGRQAQRGVETSAELPGRDQHPSELPPVGFLGATVDGQTWPLSPQLAASTNRY